MKIAFVGPAVYENVLKKDRLPSYIPVFGEALLEYGVETVYYIAIRNLDKPKILHHIDEKCYTIFIPCFVPLISKIGRKEFLIQRFVRFFEILLYLIRVLQRFPKDEIDVFIVLHLWTGMVALLNPMLKRFRPVAILFQGGSLLNLAQFKWLYYILLPLYKSVLRKPTILLPFDREQEMCLFEILKLTKKSIYFFNPVCINEKIFHGTNKEKSAKIAGFDTTKINMLSMCKILDPNDIKNLRFFDYAKNIFIALEIFRYLAKKDNKVHLHIAGSGEGMKKLKAKVFQYDLQDRVTVHGWIPNELCPTFLNAADLIINPYPLIEFNDAAAIFEAFMCEKPVVAFKRYPWVSIEQKGGFLIDKDPETGAQQVLSRLDPVYLARKAKEAKEVAYEQNVPMTTWGKELLRILTKHIKGT